MHAYLPAIGFGQIKKKSQLQQLLSSVQNFPDQVQKIRLDEESSLVFCLGCFMQSGLFLFFSKFFSESFPDSLAFQKIGCSHTRKGDVPASRLSARKEVRRCNLIAWSFKSNALFKVSASGLCGTKPPTPTKKSRGAEQRK